MNESLGQYRGEEDIAASDALGARPDWQLAAAVRDVVRYGTSSVRAAKGVMCGRASSA